ncbi:hypothetical protein [Miniphocaeibacter halophilus]|uniref:Uncharacterized protein n=1 Tax=Miniphocaeibacter halophilus TaxID=2931922 RepID=A0AC61NET3_9FIRM|nr:hypothetical protein [Miniphocaeibacter halophilus]QQK08843.1 hypothetical protein JFY71_04725 [Miniphocaeibacter halophilus]
MKKKFILLTFLAFAVMVFSSCNKNSNKETENNWDISNEEKIKQLESLNKDYEENFKSLEGFIEKTLGYLTEEEIKELAKDEVKYNILIDDKEIKDNFITVSRKDFKLVFSEKMTGGAIINTKINNLGLLEGNRYEEHMKIVGTDNYKTNYGSGTIVNAVEYDFKDIASETEFQLELTKELQERLGLENNIIKVSVKY